MSCFLCYIVNTCLTIILLLLSVVLVSAIDLGSSVDKESPDFEQCERDGSCGDELFADAFQDSPQERQL